MRILFFRKSISYENNISWKNICYMFSGSICNFLLIGRGNSRGRGFRHCV